MIYAYGSYKRDSHCNHVICAENSQPERFQYSSNDLVVSRQRLWFHRLRTIVPINIPRHYYDFDFTVPQIRRFIGKKSRIFMLQALML